MEKQILALEEKSSSSILPEEIILFEIFPRLPIKSLNRFRCVSKSCRSLTHDPCFLKFYRIHSPLRFLLSLSYPNVIDPIDFVVYDLSPSAEEKFQANLITKFELLRTFTPCAKSINGLICLASERKEIAVCNLTRKEQANFPMVNGIQLSMHDRQYIFFCHDPETNKYKVLSVTSVRDRRDYFRIQTMSFSICTLGYGPWQRFDQPGIFQLGKSRSVCINGVLYCTNFSTRPQLNDDDDAEQVIAAFVVKIQRFRTISYPYGFPRSRYNLCYLIEVDDCLAIIDMDDFMMKTFSVRLWIKRPCDSWMERRVEFPLQWESFIFRRPCYFCFSSNRNGEIVLLLHGRRSSGSYTMGCWVFCYNMERKIWRNFEVLGLEKVGFIYIEYLVIEDYLENPSSMRDIHANFFF